MGVMARNKRERFSFFIFFYSLHCSSLVSLLALAAYIDTQCMQGWEIEKSVVKIMNENFVWKNLESIQIMQLCILQMCISIIIINISAVATG